MRDVIISGEIVTILAIILLGLLILAVFRRL
jgi:hypothetical protein